MKTLELPQLDIDNVILAPKLTNASYHRTRIRPHAWNEEVAQEYQLGKQVDTTGWNYKYNFSKLNMYERNLYVCACCNEPIAQCVNNDTLHFKAEQWQEYMKMNSVIERPQVESEESNEVQAVRTTKTGRRAKGSFASVVNPDNMSNLLAEYAKGQTIAQLSISSLISVTAIRDFLAAEGVLRKKGSGINRKATRARTTQVLHPALILQAKGLVEQMGGVVKTAKYLNVNAPELSAALKAEGMTIARGRKRLAVTA